MQNSLTPPAPAPPIPSEGESHETEAGELFKRALRLAPVGDLAEKIKNQQRRLAERVMRANAQGMPRLDAVMYLSSALEAYRELEPESQKQLLAEAAPADSTSGPSVINAT